MFPLANSEFDRDGKKRLIVELLVLFLMIAAFLIFVFFLFGWPTTKENIVIYLISLLLVCVKMAFDHWKRKSKRSGN